MLHCTREIQISADCLLLQQDLDNIYSWTNTWQLHLNVSKSNKRKLVHLINNVTISWNSIVKYLNLLNLPYLGLIIVKLFMPSLNHLRYSLWGATITAKSVGYKCLIRPLLEYVSWHIWTRVFHNKSGLESVQHHTARWACGSQGDLINGVMIVSIHALA